MWTPKYETKQDPVEPSRVQKSFHILHFSFLGKMLSAF